MMAPDDKKSHEITGAIAVDSRGILMRVPNFMEIHLMFF